ncbi:phosphate ABC transporter permease PstA [Glaciihabitans arcticus]|uniref:Phosphate transport system permease protein PstA n=1 Tax=Glaciihabitans arcticus TaxID=2668039 RepID=A0A4Q9GWF8_9MICO|nr:phosphate ABC transporter permease PstA [Glaciihabitans arcticus]TBN57023.1 phosphate ABC transporter permease PstA [Glaciihabitans arcticus]
MTDTLQLTVPAPGTVLRDDAAIDAARPVREERRLNGVRISDVLSAAGAVIASLALTSVLVTNVLPINGPIPFAAIAYIIFMALYALLVSLDEDRPVVIDRVILVGVHTLAITVFVTLGFVVIFSLVQGAQALPFLNFYTEDMSLAGPLDPLSEGGVLHAIAGTLIQITIALVITIPLGLTTALFLNEVPSSFSRFVRTIVEAMTALPSIVAGLFIYASFILLFGLEKSGFAASLAISVMMLPIMIRSADVVLRLVPTTLKEASIGLGAGQWQTVWRVILPSSRSGLVTSIILATARGIGETSPVLLTSGFTASLNLDPLHGPMVSLPLAIFQFVKSPEPTMIARGFGTAAVLMLIVLALFVVARIIGGQTIDVRNRRTEARRIFWAAVAVPFLAVGRWMTPYATRVKAWAAPYLAAAGAWVARGARAAASRTAPVRARVAASRTAPVRARVALFARRAWASIVLYARAFGPSTVAISRRVLSEANARLPARLTRTPKEDQE